MTVVYMDTSSLVKLYVQEEGSTAVASQLEAAEALATSVVAYPEAQAAFSRRYREGSYSNAGFQRIKDAFERDWPHFAAVLVTMELAKAAGDLTEKHHLRGFDAIHLASALTLKNRLKTPPIFSCFDHHLNDAAEAEGFSLA